MSTEILNLLIKSVDDVKEQLDGIDTRLRNLETAFAKSEGRKSGIVTVKDVFVVLCGLGALILSIVRLTQS